MQYQSKVYGIVARSVCADMDADSSVVQSIFDRIKHMLNHAKLFGIFFLRKIKFIYTKYHIILPKKSINLKKIKKKNNHLDSSE